MTQAKIRKDNEYSVVTFNGHALYNPGNDIVCAAISTIMFMYINTLIEDSVEYELSCADADYMIKAKTEDVAPYLKMLTIGLKMIEEQYPDNVEVS